MWISGLGALAFVVIIGLLRATKLRQGSAIKAEQFVLKNKKGLLRAELRLNESDHPTLTLHGPDGTYKVILTNESLTFVDTEGTATLIAADRISMQSPYSDHTKPITAIRAGILNLRDDQGMEVAGGPGFLEIEGFGSITEISGPRIRTVDKNQRRAELGSLDLTNTGTGGKGRTSAASLVLNGKDGKVAWRALPAR
jgi:hypothetical protein